MSSSTKLYQCRLCLNKTATRVNIFGGDFPKMLEILTSIKVQENDGLPRFSCTKCAKEVQMALTIKKRIITANTILVDALRKKKMLIRKNLNPEVTISKVFEKRKKASVTNSAMRITSNTIPVTDMVTPVSPIKHESIEYIRVVENSSPNDSFDAVVKPIKEEHETLLDAQQDGQALDDQELQQIIDEVETQIKQTGFTCETCNITFADKSTYNQHSMKHKKSKCQVCGRLIRSDNFKKHVMMHTAGPSVCSLCGATCKNIESLRGHIFYQHKNSAEQYICEECGKSFRIKYKFVLHKKKEHLGVRNFKCDICGKGFFTNGDLMGHKKMTHEKLRPHVCEYCGTGFSSNYALKTHKRQHTNEKPFICEYCNEGFRQRVSLRSHLKSKHGIEEAKEWFCKICEKGFATSYALSIHLRLHQVEKCEVCSEAFGSSEFLTNHLWEVHNVKKETDTST